MGNDFNLTKSCVGVSELCTEEINVEELREKSYALQHKKLRSTEEIKQKILKYIEKNRLQLYSTREKKVLETLVSVDQEHISDKIIEMDKRLKFLEQEKRELSRKDNKTEQENSINSTEIDIKTEKLAKTTTELFILKEKRKKLFDEAECLMLEDFDMILEQIPNFDQKFHSFNDVINLSQEDGKIKENENEIGITQSTNFNLSNTEKFTSNNESMLKMPTNMHKENEEKKISTKNKILHPLKSHKEKKYEEKLKEALRIEDKKVLRKNSEIARIGAEILKDNDLLMIIPIECFSGRGALTYNRKTGLPSNISLLQILAHKIKAVSMRRGCTLGVAFLVNENYEKQFKDELSKTEGFENYECDKVEMNSNLSNLTDANSQPISYHVIPFRNIWPSFDKENKILLNSEEKGGINFTPQDGDLIGFIEDSMELKILIEKYQYINLTNVNNLLSQVGDAYALGYLGSNEGLDIVAKLLRPSEIEVELKEYFHLDEKGFVSIKVKELTENNKNQKEERLEADLKLKYAVYKKNQAFFNTEEYYIRSRIFTTESGPLKRLLMSRITRCLDTESFDNESLRFYLHRSPSSMLYYKFSAFLLIDEENEFSHAKNPSINHFHMNGEIGYSRYCKKLLGLKQSSEDNEEEEMVEIDAGILHKGSEEMRKILKELRKVKEVGFPIILYSNFFNNESQT